MKRENCAHPQYAVEDTRDADARIYGDMKFTSFCTLCGARGYFSMRVGHVWTTQPDEQMAEIRRAGHVLELEG